VDQQIDRPTDRTLIRGVVYETTEKAVLVGVMWLGEQVCSPPKSTWLPRSTISDGHRQNLVAGEFEYLYVYDWVLRREELL
jgi:hypothetical protein